MAHYDNFTTWFFDAATTEVHWAQGLKDVLEWTDEEVIRLSGAPARSTLSIARFDLDEDEGTGIRLTVQNPILLDEPMIRDVIITEKGIVVSHIVRNQIFNLRPEFRGMKLGPRSCAIEISQAKEFDFDFIDVWAVGNAASSKDRQDQFAMSGFAVWPRLGFDGDIPTQVLAKMPPSLSQRGLTKVSQLMAFKEGVEFWDVHGDECRLRFDLSDATCWKTLNSYLMISNIQVQI
ncbi:MAG TPA: hypothetical protein VFX55_09370 [Duganella sp.]|nr:hypothetical protein [Duganella sp.]